MSDLVKELRGQAVWLESYGYRASLEREAAERIERLEAAIREHRDHNLYRSDRKPCSSDEKLWAVLDIPSEDGADNAL